VTGFSDAIFIALTEGGAVLARRLSAALPGSQVHGLEGRVTGADRDFVGTLDHVRLLYEEKRPIIGLFSTAIMIRAIAGSIQPKSEAPPVLCLAEDGSAIVPLLGGHRGANEMARRLGKLLDIAPAITTAGDARLGIALDNPPPGWGLSGRPAAKPVMAAMLAGRPVALINDLPATIDTGWLTGHGFKFRENGSPLSVHLTERRQPATGDRLCLHPRTLVLGVGCERGIGAEELADLVTVGVAESGFAVESVACITTIDLKEHEAAILALAEKMDLPIRLFSAAELEEQTPRLATPSETVFTAVGCHGVAEAAALAAAGGDARLALPKRKSRRATMAIAQTNVLVVPNDTGRAPGLLSIIGIGPGKSGWRAPDATDAIARATDIVAYRLYIDLLGDLTRGKELHGYELGQERDRCAEALDLAASGKRVALVSSGDAGIYAMASLVFELVDTGDNPAWRRLAIDMVPGISALQALAAKGGAPLGHDFCAISLSDLLTPWPVIEQRVRAAAEGDFVVALYNPVSKRRTEQLLKAREILLRSRPPDTPVLLGRNLGRPGEKVEIITLQELESDRVDMLTTVIVGSNTTRRISSGGKGRIYTPRGYLTKGSEP
jgi:cobalt-precorrin 5A hydrolase/precorrin-3B C17-methyltransferase